MAHIQARRHGADSSQLASSAYSRRCWRRKGEHVTSDQWEWTDLDERAVDTLRVLSADAVEQVGNGHPGTAMSLAPAAYLLFQHHLRHDPADPDWIGRDRFVLSCGHSSLTLYLQLYLSGYGVELSDIASFRTLGSMTPGHPEYGHTPGVETTTGPLGQGIAMGVGMAMAARYERGLLDPAAAPGESLFDHHVYVLASDGDIQEGISAEASAIAGTQQLRNLTVIWDDNEISIEGDTALAMAEDVVARYRAQGWHTETVPMLADGRVDVAGLHEALLRTTGRTEQPVFIALQSIIGWPAPTKQNTADAHGAKLGADEVAAVKRALGFDPDERFAVDPAVLAHARQVGERAQQSRALWDQRLRRWEQDNPERSALLERLRGRGLPDGLPDLLPDYRPGDRVATRAASGTTLNALAAAMPELWGGSADLGGSNNTSIKGGGSFLPADAPVAGADPYGRVLHFGVREHAMGAILNGIALSGLTRPFAGTFLTFSDYMRGAVRLSALMQAPVVYVWTHDSIGLGEDGPTHQPIEHLWSLRAMPGLAIVRPADAVETAHAWLEVLRRGRPAGLSLTRQSVEVLDHTADETAAGVARGAYVLAEAAGGDPAVLLLATGSEVGVAMAARSLLQADGIATRVVSMPCLEWFNEQDRAYRDHVLPPEVKARVSVEAGATLGWWRYVGDQGEVVGIDRFGASADGAVLYQHLGVTPQAVAAAARRSLAQATSQAAAPLGVTPIG
jgi:transketolase